MNTILTKYDKRLNAAFNSLVIRTIVSVLLAIVEKISTHREPLF